MDEINQALETYEQKWHKLLEGRKNTEFFASLKPTAVGWKTEDRAEYDRLVAELHDQADNIIEKWMNDRWIAKVHLKNTQLANGVEIIKIMQRRPGSTDASGLDHVDLYTKADLARNREILIAEPGLKWSEESNDVLAGYDWLSIWFEDTEVKIKSDTILDIVGIGLKQLNEKILAT